MNREAWRAAIHGVAKSRIRLNDWTGLNWITSYTEHLFMCLLVICMSSLNKFSFTFSTHFLLDCLVFYIELHILEINPLSVASSANIFSHSVGCLFIFFMVSFAVQKLLNLIRSHLFIFVFIFITLGGGSKRAYYDLCQRVLPMFCSKSFIVYVLIFRLIIHFEFIFMYSVRSILISFSYMWLSSFPSLNSVKQMMHF